jgi:hypothetical protein
MGDRQCPSLIIHGLFISSPKNIGFHQSRFCGHFHAIYFSSFSLEKQIKRVGVK